MKNPFQVFVLAAACSVSSFSPAAAAEAEQEKLASEIFRKDSLFWNAYNTCDTNKFKEFFTDDVEFYHDKGGPIVGADPLTENLKKNLCGGSGSRLRREVVAGTEKVFPLWKDNIIYGAILSGEHVFYVTEKGKSEYLDGHANFTHLWLKKDGDFRMARILSYDHRPASPARKEAKVN